MKNTRFHESQLDINNKNPNKSYNNKFEKINNILIKDKENINYRNKVNRNYYFGVSLN